MSFAFHPSQRSRRQGGFALMSTLLALVIAALLSKTQIDAQQLKSQLDAGTVEAQVINQIAQAVNVYTMEVYPELQNNLPVTKAGITLQPGNAPGQALSPSIADLITMGYLPTGTAAQSLYVQGGAYQVRLRRDPAACVGTDCNFPGIVYIDRAATIPGTTQMNGPMINGFVTSLGGDALFSTNVAPAALAGPSIDPASPPANPLGLVEGVIGSRAGFGAAGYGRFLTLNDPRDPNFRGDVTVQGRIESKTSISLTDAADACDLARLWVNATGVSEFLASSATCVRRAWVSGDGTVGVADATGVRRADMNGNDGSITSFGADGVTPRAGFTYNATGQSDAFADNLRNSAAAGSPNAAGIAIDGRVYGRLGQFNSVVLNNSASVFQACTQAGEMVWGNMNGNPMLLKCEGGRYVPADGSAIALEGASCSPNGSTARSQTGVQLICEGSVWKPTLNRIGRVQMDDSIIATTGTVVGKPACTIDGTPHIMLMPRILNSTSGVLNYAAVDQGASWQILISDNDGNTDATSQALAHTYCAY